MLGCLTSYSGVRNEGDTIPHLKMLEVSHIYQPVAFFYEDVAITKADTLLQKLSKETNISYLLSLASPMIIRDYGGPGAISIPSYRGASASQTLVRWNGFSLNNATTGEVDLSLIPASFIENVSVVHNPAGALFGSNTFGGVVELNTGPQWKSGSMGTISMQAGSFQNYQYGAGFKTGNDLVQYTFSGMFNHGLNNYPYKDIYKAGNPEVNIKHNALKRYGHVQNLFLKLPRQQKLELGFWHFVKHRELPPQLGTSGKGTAHQSDSTIKTYIKYSKRFSDAEIQFSSGWFYDYLKYTDKYQSDSKEYAVYSVIQSSRWMNSINFRRYFNQKLVADFSSEYTRINSDVLYYTGKPVDNRFSVAAAAKYIFEHLVTNVSVRQEFSQLYQTIPLVSVGARYALIPGEMSARVNVANRFRIPTFNELFWVPGGDDELSPEHGFGSDISLEWKKNVSQLKYELEFTTYTNRINDYIVWVPVGAHSFARNYREVWNRGAEISAGLSSRSDSRIFYVRGFYNYNRSTVSEVYDNEPAEKGNQLRYVPIHSGKFILGLGYKSFSMIYNTVYTGERFLNDQNKGVPLKGFLVHNVNLNYTWTFHHYGLDVFGRVNNFLNTDYIITPSFPMPGRMFQVGLRLSYNSRD